MRKRVDSMVLMVLSISLLLGGTVTGQCEVIALDVPPYISGGQVMVPLGPIVQWLGGKTDDQGAAIRWPGAKVEYQGEVTAFTARHGDIEVRLRAGDRHALVNGVQVPIDGRPTMENSHVESRDRHLFVPLTFVAEALELQVKWDTTVGGFATVADSNRSVTLARFPLHWTAGNGRTDLVEGLLDRGVSANAKADAGWTPLHWAAKQGQTEAARLLIDRGADVKAQCTLGWSPLQWAAATGRAETVKLLRELGGGR